MRNRLYFQEFTAPLAAGLLALSAWGSAPAPGQTTFATPRAAARALFTAAKADDVAAMMKIFGPTADEILNSGDAVADKRQRERFTRKATQSLRTSIAPGNPNRATLLIGKDPFPFPIPVARAGGRWYFDTAAGKTEILARRIGSNELDAIAACKAYVEAQYDYAAEDRNRNGVPEYARKLISSPGKRDGLFWPESDAPPTQFTAEVKNAHAEGYRRNPNTAAPAPYHGYNFRILTAQGPKARGGTLDYVQHGLMIAGFALVAWPAEYGVSGIKTFLVNQNGVVYEKNLGPPTRAAVEAMTAFNPDSTWQRAR